MKHIDDLCHHFPDLAKQIRRDSLRDPRFRSICDDYGEALCAIERWRHGGGIAKQRADEFRGISEDLREEVHQYLKTHGGS